MTLQDIFDQLTSGELSQLSIGGAEAGSVPQAGYATLTRNIQLGLTALYTRFNLKEGRSTAPLLVNQLEYTIANPNVLKVTEVRTDAGKELDLNQKYNLDSCFTEGTSLLTIPAHIAAQGNDLAEQFKTASLTLVFRSNHPKLDMTLAMGDPSGVVLELPDAYTQALLLFVASRVYTPHGMDGNFNPGNNFFGRYEAECQRLEAEGLQNGGLSQSSRLLSKGFA
jgi:hypothetical protein